MDPVRLMAEWLAYRDLSAVERDHLGLTWEACQRAGGVVKAKVKTIGMTWEPAESGVPHVIVPAWAGVPPSIFQGVEHPTLIDMIALTPDAPEFWHWRTRQAFALGQDQIDMARTTAAPIILHLDPLHWLRANCIGAVLLDYPMARAA